MPTERTRAPLEGAGVVVTRDEDDEGRLTAALEARGAAVLHWPTLRAAPPEDPGPLAAALDRLDRFDWLVLTSRRAVDALTRARDAGPVGGSGAAGAERPKVAAVGRATAEAARAAGWRVDLVPATETGEGLVTALAGAGVGPGARVLFPASEIARPAVPEGLRGLGAEVERVTAYRILPAPLDRDACRRALVSGRVRVVTLTSPSAVRGLRVALGEELFAELARVAVFAAIGPTTGAAAREAGVGWVIEAEDRSFDGLADRVVEWSRTEGERGAQ